MATMKAVQIRMYKDRGDLVPREVPRPEPALGEVLVKVRYAAVNPSDVFNTQGYFPEHTVLPRIIGRDFVGEVVSGAAPLLGKIVLGSGGDVGFKRDGTFAEYLSLPAEAVVEVPAGLEPTQAATLGVPFLAAKSCLDAFGRDLSGKSVLLVGGTGAVGSAATLIARKRGARTVRTMLNSAELAALAPGLRDGEFLDLSGASALDEQARAMTGGRGFDAVVNMVGGMTFEPSMRALAEYGKMACIASPGQPVVSLNLLEFYRRNLSLFGFNTALVGAVDSARALRELFTEFSGEVDKLAWLGATQVVPFAEAQSVIEKMLRKELRKPVFAM
jgi:NADPH:quinone reductase-like Zn-dependent oxidoreductase